MQPELAIIFILLLLLLYLGWRYVSLKKNFDETKAFIDEISRGNTKKRLLENESGDHIPLFSSLNELAEKFGQNILEVEEARTRLKITLKSLPDGIALLDEVGYARLVNPSFERIFSIERTNLINKRLLEIVKIPQLNTLLDELKNEESNNKVEVFLDKIGMHIEFKVSRIRIEKVKNIGTIVIARDITNEKMAYETRREFVANVSHELKTPITAILGSAETLLDGALEDKKVAGTFLTSITNQTKRMEILIRDLITLSKIELGAIPLEKTYISPVPVINEVFDNFSEKARKKNIYLRKDIQDEYLHIEADPDRLFQILTNLVGNALNYTSEGGVTVTLEKKMVGWCLTVEDTGCGIPKKYLSRLGERFFRVDPSRSRELGGTGLGLAIVKHLVKSHNWEMLIESEVGVGTKVIVIGTKA